jgi:hypothetical protein
MEPSNHAGASAFGYQRSRSPDGGVNFFCVVGFFVAGFFAGGDFLIGA